MINGSKLFLPCFAAVFFLLSCASIANLEGGAKDTTPPKPDSTRSSKNFQTRFQKQEIVLSFDEWIKLEDPSQVVISPPTEKKPTIQLKGKTVRFKFDDAEILRPNTTYTLNFGESIKDVTEGNKSNFRFVFSTGDRIDSNKVRVTVLDAKKNEPLENVLVMMYDQLNDSVVKKERPLYFAKTGKNGSCTIENVRNGNFKIFALQDGNQNFKYDLPTEKIGFSDKPLGVQPDTPAIVSITLFDSDLPISVKEVRQKSYGQVKVVFSKNASPVIPQMDSGRRLSILEYQQDTLTIWYHQSADNPWKCKVLKDTINVKTEGRTVFLNKAKLQLIQTRKVAGNGKESIHPALPVNWTFNHPIVRLDSSKIQILDDSSGSFLKGIRCQTDNSSPRTVKIKGDWLENHLYTIKTFPGAFSDLFNLTNDTIVQHIQIAQRKKFGEISLKISGLKKNISYLVQLFNPNGAPEGEMTISGLEEQTIAFINLNPSIYEVQITEDLNQNGRWDSGNYYEHRQPERLIRKKLEDLKPNWTLESEIKWQ